MDVDLSTRVQPIRAASLEKTDPPSLSSPGWPNSGTIGICCCYRQLVLLFFVGVYKLNVNFFSSSRVYFQSRVKVSRKGWRNYIDW